MENPFDFLVASGELTCEIRPNGDRSYTLTEKGRQRAQEVLRRTERFDTQMETLAGRLTEPEHG